MIGNCEPYGMPWASASSAAHHRVGRVHLGWAASKSLHEGLEGRCVEIAPQDQLPRPVTLAMAANDAHRARIDVEALEPGDTGATRSRKEGLDRIAVGDEHPHRVRPMIVRDRVIEVAEASGESRGHLGERLARVALRWRKGGLGRFRSILDDAPQGVLGKICEGAAGPGTVVALPQRVVLLDLQCPGQQGGGLEAALHGAGDDPRGADRLDHRGQRGRLVATLLGESHIRCPARQHTCDVRAGLSMADQEDGGHVAEPIGGHNGAVIVDKALYRRGVRQACGDLSDELGELADAGEPGDFLWVGLKDPTTEEFHDVNEELGLHPLAIEDADTGRQRVKFERYGHNVALVVLRPLRYIEATSDIESGELIVIVGDRFLLTVRRGEATPLAGVRQQLESEPELLARGPMAALHAILDRIVDEYRLIDMEVAADVEAIENDVFADHDVDTSAIYRLKREILEFKRAVGPLSTPLHALFDSPMSPVKDPELRLLFRDVADHAQLVMDHIDGYDRLLADMLTAHLAAVGVRQNNDMRKISAWVAIAALPTMLAGIYGMNFEYMPELKWSIDIGGDEFHYGYFVVLLVMAGSCVTLYRAFRRSGWL